MPSPVPDVHGGSGGDGCGIDRRTSLVRLAAGTAVAAADNGITLLLAAAGKI